MTEDGKRFRNRDLIIMLIVFVFSFTVVALASNFIIHFSIPNILGFLVGEITFTGLMMIFLVYRQRFQDERSVQILDKSGKNGFVAMLFLLPLFLMASSLLPYSYYNEVAWALIEFCGCSTVIVVLSAIYYYRK